MPARLEMPKITLLDLTDADAEEAERMCNEDDETQPNWAGPWEQLAYYRRHCLSYRQQVAALKEELKEMAKLVANYQDIKAELAAHQGEEKPKYELCDTVFPSGEKCARPKNHHEAHK